MLQIVANGPAIRPDLVGMGRNPGLPVDAVLERRPETTDPDPPEGKVIQLHEHVLERERREQRWLVEQFIRASAGSLRKLAARLVTRSYADDVVQDAFEHFTRKFATDPEFRALLRSPGELYRFMCTITIRRGYDLLRRNWRAAQSTAAPQVMNNIPGKTQLSDGVPVGVAVARLARAYETLPPLQRVIHVLKYYCEYRHDQISEILHISVSNSKRLVFVANKALRKALEIDP